MYGLGFITAVRAVLSTPIIRIVRASAHACLHRKAILGTGSTSVNRDSC